MIEIDNTTVTHTVKHVYRSDYWGNHGKDMCLEMFGEDDEECRAYNAALDERSNTTRSA